MPKLSILCKKPGDGVSFMCRDSDTLRKHIKSSSTGRVALKYFNRT